MERHTAVTYLDPNCLKLIVYLILDGTSSRYDHSFQATHMVLSPKDLALLLGNDPRIYFLKYLHMVFGKEWTGKTDEDLGHSPGAKAPRQLSSTGISIWGRRRAAQAGRGRRTLQQVQGLKGWTMQELHQISMNRRKATYCYNKVMSLWKKGCLSDFFKPDCLILVTDF